MKINKQNIGWIIAVILFMIIIGGLMYFYYQDVSKTFYNQGLNDGAVQIINSISQSGNIPYFDNQTIKTISITQLCQQGK